MAQPNLDKVCCILDFSGTYVKNYFIVREMAIIDARKKANNLNSRLYDYKPYANRILMLKRGGRAAKAQKFYDITQLDSHIVEYWNKAKSNTRDVVAYKGGTCELNKLTELNIPCVNLESFGCPAYEVLRSRGDVKKGCCYHRAHKLHCPRSEILSFKRWLLQNM